MKRDTSWENVAEWYHGLLEGDKDSYQRKVILPNSLRLLEIKKGQIVLDLACGEGFFPGHFKAAGASVIGVDASSKLIEIARKNNPEIKFHIAPAHKLGFLKNSSVDSIAIILALQNIENAKEVLSECRRVLKEGGKLLLILNHPAFRVPKESSWGWDEAGKTQYRRIDEYLSESKVKIQMHPGSDPYSRTVSFHRPLQYYFKLLKNTGFCALSLEEWTSHRRSQPGPRAKAEDKARHEIPLFLSILACFSPKEVREKSS
jgi:ubiquinone/menaquinone biosynthesis C-methylase UbiE